MLAIEKLGYGETAEGSVVDVAAAACGAAVDQDGEGHMGVDGALECSVRGGAEQVGDVAAGRFPYPGAAIEYVGRRAADDFGRWPGNRKSHRQFRADRHEAALGGPLPPDRGIDQHTGLVEADRGASQAAADQDLQHAATVPDVR